MANQGFKPVRWLLLDGNRHAVTAALFTFVFTSLTVVGSVWTFEMQRLLTETDSVQTLLNTLLSGIILLVSIVVSINSIVLSHDITTLGSQRNRFENARQFRRDVGNLVDTKQSPTAPDAFLVAMIRAIHERANALKDAVDDDRHGELAEEISRYANHVAETVEDLEDTLEAMEAEGFAILWLGMSYKYGPYVDQLREFRIQSHEQLPDGADDRLEDLATTFELFATGKEYFKTLYYVEEFSQLSQSLLAISLPTLIVDAIVILALDAGLIPNFWLFGIPPLVSFVAATFAISLVPYVLLTAFMLRVATVAKRTNAAGPFVLES
ncbi:hypothetical protein VB773_22490 [Haloarculaceae archaeon H-GB2-1]|nr:hypothetical protein [Haloarculaceae archaeon H-GB1-1]MEA5389478.1 hypothetical protein [Haloarculaceae archaeon H-GB11]MEA5410069.1 hypothetical protein [Haloarculaceae archaeon H-GB2-1]